MRAVKFSDLLTTDARARLLGERLAETRLAQNITQADAAARAGISRETVKRAERGRSSVDTLLRLLAVYDIADRLELVLPEARPAPEELLAAERAPRRKRARRRATSGKTAPSSIWGDDG